MIGSFVLKGLKKHWFKLVIAFVVLVLFLKWVDISEAMIHLDELSYFWFALAGISLVIVQIIKSFRFHFLTRSVNLKVDMKRNIMVHLIVPIIGLVTPGKLGEGLKVFLLRKDKKTLGFCFILEKLSDMLLLALLGMGGILLFRNFVNFYLVFVALLVIGVICLLKIEKILNFIFRKNIFEDRWFIRSLKSMVFFDFVILTFLTLLNWAGNFLASFLVLLAFGIQLNFMYFSVLMALALLVGLVSGIPGGIGPREFSITFLLTLYFGLDKGLVGSFALVSLALHYFVFLIIGVVAYICWCLAKKSF